MVKAFPCPSCGQQMPFLSRQTTQKKIPGTRGFFFELSSRKGKLPDRSLASATDFAEFHLALEAVEDAFEIELFGKRRFEF